jgi:O-antigen/teichoic acid export membrane protein
MSLELKRLLKFSMGSWITFSFSFIASPITTFFLVPEEFGKFASFILFQTLAIYLITLGMDQVLMRFYYQAENKTQLLLKCLFVEIVSFSVLLIILLAFSSYLNFFITGLQTPDLALAIEGATLCLLLSISNLGLGLVRMQNRAVRFSSIQIANSIVNYSAFFLILIFVDRTYKAFIYASLVSASFQLIIIYFFTIRIPITEWLYFFKEKLLLKRHFEFGLPFVPTFFIDYAFSNSDRYFMRFFGGFGSLGVYSLGLRFSSAFNVVQTGFHTYWTPFSYDRHQENPTAKEFYPKVFDLLNWGLLSLILMAHSFRELITYIIAPQYHNVIGFFSFLLFTPYLYSLTEVTQVGINFSLKTRLFLWINLATLAINIFFGYFLIQQFGQMGAALNVASTSLVLFVLKSYFGIKNYSLPIDWIKFALSFLSVFLFVTIDLFIGLTPISRFVFFAVDIVFVAVLYRRSILYLRSLLFKS